MSADVTAQEQHLTPGAQRILDVASELFYWRGIHTVGVDTIAAESGVTKRTLYDQFGSKDALVAAYLAARDRRWRAVVLSRVDSAYTDPVQRVLAPFDVMPECLAPRGRGCTFINAFADLPDPEHPGHQVIVADKKWLRDLFRRLLVEAGISYPDNLAVQLLSLHEGAIISYSIADEPTAPAITRTAAETLLAHTIDHPSSH